MCAACTVSGQQRGNKGSRAFSRHKKMKKPAKMTQKLVIVIVAVGRHRAKPQPESQLLGKPGEKNDERHSEFFFRFPPYLLLIYAKLKQASLW